MRAIELPEGTTIDLSSLRAAARDGDVKSMAELGAFLVRDYPLAQELGMPTSYCERFDEGTDWLRRAAREGHGRAMIRVADMAARNDEPDEQERWLRNAAEIGAPGALART